MPYNVNMTKEVIIYIASGLLLALAYVFVVYYFDRNIKSIIDVENKTELPIMGPSEIVQKTLITRNR